MPEFVSKPVVPQRKREGVKVDGIYRAYVANSAAWQCNTLDYRFVGHMSKAEIAAAEAEARAAGKRLGDEMVAAGAPFGPITIRPGRLLSPAGISFATPHLAAFRQAGCG